MVTLGSVKKKEFELMEQGEYVLTLHSLEETQGLWGDRIIWKFMVAPKEDYAAYICRADGEEKTVWAFTDVDIILGSLGHELAQTLSGRRLDADGDPPNEDDLIGKRCLAYVTHETPTRGKNAGQKRESIVAGSIKPFKGPAMKVAANVTPPSGPTAHAELVEAVAKQIGKCVKLNTANHLEYVGLDLENADDDQLAMLLNTIKEEVAAALND